MRTASGRARQARFIRAAATLAGVLAGCALLAVAVGQGSGNAMEPWDWPFPIDGGQTPPPPGTPSPTPEPTRAGVLDGVVMSEDEWAARKDLLPVAVMIDNSADAYPQWGLATADLVYEGLVEGGITRLMAVYWRRESEYIEPVRSARTPFVIWADELSALYAHAGEADTDNEANAGGQIREWNILDLSAFAPVADSAFYRDEDRYAPHNLVTSTSSLREAGAALGYAGPPALDSWTYKGDGEGTSDRATAAWIDIDFIGSGNSWQTAQWRWDPDARSYGRFEFGWPHMDPESGRQLHFTNVVVARFDSEVVDDSGHVVLNQFGSGAATVFLDGKKIDGFWAKSDLKSRIRFYDSDGVEVQFNRGPTFVEVIGQNSTLFVPETISEAASSQ